MDQQDQSNLERPNLDQSSGDGTRVSGRSIHSAPSHLTNCLPKSTICHTGETCMPSYGQVHSALRQRFREEEKRHGKKQSYSFPTLLLISHLPQLL